jgi:hypothetical protein
MFVQAAYKNLVPAALLTKNGYKRLCREIDTRQLHLNLEAEFADAGLKNAASSKEALGALGALYRLQR